MKSTSPSRLSCRLVRAWSVVAPHGPESGGLGAGHVGQCAACQEYFASAAEFESSLRRSAARQAVTPTPGLESRIMRAITDAAPAPKRRAMHSGLLMIAGAAAAVALTLGVLTRNHVPPPVVDGFVATKSAAGGDVGSNLTWTSLTAPVSSAIQKDPLQKEVDSVYADARSAAHFLALNFLPEAPDTTRANNGT